MARRPSAIDDQPSFASPGLFDLQPDCGLPHIDTRMETSAALAEAERSHHRLREAIDVLPQGIVFLDAGGRYILWNKKYTEIYDGMADLLVVGAYFRDTMRMGVARGEYPDAIGREEQFIAERLAKLKTPGARHEQILSDGRVILIEERLTESGDVVGIRVDITELKQREASFRLLFDSNPLPMIVCSVKDDRILSVNDSAVEHYGYARPDFERLTIRQLQAYVSGRPWDPEPSAENGTRRTWTHIKADGALIELEIYHRSLTYRDEPAVMLAMTDVTERKRAEMKVAFLKQHDGLTGLPNRRQLHQRLGDILAQHQRSSRSFGLLVLGIDHFKVVNENFGHAIGDRLLRKVAGRLRSSTRRENVVSRLDSDVFAIVQTAFERPEEIESFAREILAALGEPFLIDGHSIMIGATIGIAMAATDGDEPDRLLKNAEMALSLAKSEQRDAIRFFKSDMDARAQARRSIEIDLRAAIRNDVLRPYYQPLVNLATGRITGVEALVRWPHPERGMISPADFIPIAESTGLINPLGIQILKHACSDAVRWPDDIHVAVNLSPLQFRAGNLLSIVTDTLRQTGLSPHRLELEITETLLLDKSDQVLETLHALRALGVRIAMDDFGTGYSSLSYLRSFPFDKIKIDRTFVSGLGENREGQAILRAIVSLGTGLGVTITAEGVETESELRCLRAEGCDEGQGYLFSPARPFDEMVDILKAQTLDRGEQVRREMSGHAVSA